MNNKTTNVRYLAQLALLAAIEVVMKLMGLGSVPVGPLYMSFLTVPIAVGAMTMGPTAGAILGGVFGCVSFKDALAGGGMTGMFFQISPINTFVLCVVMRVLMGWCVGLLFRVLRRVDHKKELELFRWCAVRAAAEYHFLHGLHRSGVLQDRLHSGACCLSRRGQPADVRRAAGRCAGSDRNYRRLCGRRRARPCGSIVPRSSCTCKSRINDC